MFNNLDHRHAAQIDSMINLYCGNPTNYHELTQLRTLFSWSFHRQLEALLNGTLGGAAFPSMCEVQLGWIDKIPLAQTSVSDPKTELGDAVIFAFDERRDHNGNLLSQTARAVLLQAKIAKSQAQLHAPSVPVGSGKSTQRELYLLSQWPQFDLFQTSGHSSACLKDVVVALSIPPPAPHAWFIAAPAQSLTAAQKAAWPCWWMAGEARQNALCGTSIGELLVAFLAPAASTIAVGAPFRRPAASGSPPRAGIWADWSDLCNEILKILTQYDAPKHLFGPRQSRLYKLALQVANFAMASPHEAIRYARVIVGEPLDRMSIPPAPPPEGQEEDGGMIVMIVTVTRFEEEGRRLPE